MVNKPSSNLEYSEEDITSVRRCCLYLATKLGDLADDIVIVGGLVPSLLIEQAIPAERTESYSPFATHAGTRDLDLGLALSILDKNKYTELTARMRNRRILSRREQSRQPNLPEMAADRTCLRYG